MPKLRVWIAMQSTDSACYNLIGKTKKSVMELVDTAWNKEDFHTLIRTEITYQNAFDLFSWLTGEGGHRDEGVGTTLSEINLKK